MFILGVDPGKTGAIAVWDPDTRELIIIDMPDTVEGIATAVSGLRNCQIAFIELVGGVGRQSASSSFTFGFVTGAVHAAIACQGVEIVTVSPMKWKAAYGLKRQPGETDSSFKGRSRRLAAELLPEYSKQFRRAKDDGRAEAALIAYYGAASLGQGRK